MNVSTKLPHALRALGYPRSGCQVTSAPHGSALITALVFTVIIALALAGIGTLTVSHYTLAHAQAASSDALDVAEAGVNFELHRITANIANADLAPGTTYTASNAISPGLAGTFTVYCANQDGSAWNAATAKNITITCTGLVNGARRAVRIQAKPYGAFYTLYSTKATAFSGDNAIVNGVAGTNGKVSVAANLAHKPQIQGLAFNGPNAGWNLNQNPGGYNPVKNSKTVTWPSVSSILNAKFPGGENYLSQPANNDNALAVLDDPANPTPAGQPKPMGIVDNKMHPNGTQIVTLKGKPGGANYYLDDIFMTEQSNLVFDNTTGPINIYYLHKTGGGSFIQGGHALKSMSEAPQYPVEMYLSSTGSLDIKPGNINGGDPASNEIDMGIYAYDTTVLNGTTLDFGNVTVDSNTNFRGQIISKNIYVSGINTQITGQKGYFDTPNEYFGFSGGWQELDSGGNVGGVNQ